MSSLLYQVLPKKEARHTEKEKLEQERNEIVEQIETLSIEDVYKEQLKVLRKEENAIDDVVCCGFARESVKSLNKSLIYPIDLNYIIVKYYAIYDMFDDKHISMGLTGDNSTYIRNANSGIRDNIFGDIKVKNDERKIWKIAIVEPCASIYIGIVESTDNDNFEQERGSFCFYKNISTFGVCSHNGNFYYGVNKNDSKKIKKQYIYPFDDNDVDGKIVYITMDLNLINDINTLSFRFDNWDCGIAYKFDKIECNKSYRLAVTLPSMSSVYLIR